MGAQTALLVNVLRYSGRLRAGLRGPGTPACGGSCGLDTAGLVLESIVIAMLIGMMFLWGFYMARSFRNLHKSPYSEFRLGNIVVRYQVSARLQAWDCATFCSVWFSTIGWTGACKEGSICLEMGSMHVHSRLYVLFPC